MQSFYNTHHYKTDLDISLSCCGSQTFTWKSLESDHESFVKKLSFYISWFNPMDPKHSLINIRAATFTHVNGTGLCFCNKRLQN